MLKFVSTKPPRGRSPSGSLTPDRDDPVRFSSHSESSPRTHSSPRFGRKHYSSSQSHTYPNARGTYTPSKTSYHPVHTSPRRYTISSSGDIKRLGDSSTDVRPLKYPEYQHHHYNHATKQQQQQQMQPSPQQIQHQHRPQPPWSYQNVASSYKQSTPNEYYGRYGTLSFSDPQPKIFNSSATNNKFPLDLKDTYSSNAQKDVYKTFFDDARKIQTLPAEAQVSFLGRNFQNVREPPNVRESSNVREPPNDREQFAFREPIKITPEYVGDRSFKDITNYRRSSDYVGDKSFKDITNYRRSSDYDLAKAIPDDADSGDQTQPVGPRTTQYIIKETLTKKKASTSYIPPPGSGIKPYTTQEIITEQAPFGSSTLSRKFEYPQTSGTRQPELCKVINVQDFPAGTQQVMTTCVSQVPAKSSNDVMNRTQSSKRAATGISSQTQSTISSSTMRDILNKSQEQSQMEGALTLDVVHITNRIISMTFPSEDHDSSYSFNLKEAVRLLKAKLGDSFLILNLSEKHEELVKAHPQVKEFGWPDHLAPPLERLCSLCKAIDSWLSTDIRHVVVLHCKGGCSRLASVIAAYMHYNNICASADQAVDSLAMKRYYDEKLGGLALPSQRRYVSYFSGLLSGTIKINSNPVYLHHILIHGVPNFDARGGCCPYIKVYQSMQPIFTSGVYNVTDNMQKVCISITPGIPLRGDILIKCYHKKTKSSQKEVIWRCQFHTCAVAGNNIIFSKQELDDAALDPRFPDNGKVEFVFGPSSDVLVSVSGFKSDVTVPIVDNEESLVRSDSYEDFNKASELAVDGYPGHTTSFNSHFTSSAATSSTINPSYSSSQVQPTNQSNSATTRRTDQTFQERMQLDELLSNLLSDQVYISPTHDSSKSVQKPVQAQQNQLSPGSTGDSITISPVMNSAKTVTTTTRTFTTYSSTDAHHNPDAVLIQRAEVSYKVPEPNHFTAASDSTDMQETIPSKSAQPHHRKGVPNNAFSYTSGVSNSKISQRADFVEHDVVKNQPEQSLQSPPSSQLTYYPKFEPKRDTTSSAHTYSSLDGETNSWLAQQQKKLKNFREGRDASGHTEQEKKLVNELQFAQNKYYTHYKQNEVDEQASTDTYKRQPLHNGPSYPEGVTSPYAAPHSSQSSSAVVGHRQDQFYNTSSYVESHTYGDKRSNKPPPSPTMQRSQPPGSAPLPVPVRSSSKEFMRTLSNSSSSNWQQHHQPLQRQHSETLYDRSHDVDHIQPRSYGSTHNTPPHSPPRAVSPSGPSSTTTYTAYRTIDRQKEIQDDIQRARVAQQQQQQVLPPQQLPTQVNHHYVTEVFVHRSDTNQDHTDSTTRLHELEKNLEAATQSIKSSQQHVVQQVPHQQVFEESLVSHASRQYHTTYQETEPQPLRVKEIEEDRIILRPIGPGVQTLEPEIIHTGTLGRPPTPGFPTGPGGGHQLISPTATLQPSQQQQQQQHQTVQYQQYQSQQNQTQATLHDGQTQGTLHIDTSPRMIAPHSLSSAGSPQSPGSYNTLRHQMSDSVGSLGPHSVTGQSSPSVYFGLSRRGSLSSLTDSDMVHATPKFVKDTSRYWYKPNISRDEAIQMLKDKPPGAFVIRDSNSFPGAYGLALKVATLPPNVQAKTSGDPQADLVRHFLIEPTPKGVRLRGCSNEPVFGSLAALVYQHSITPLALPWKLALPEPDAVNGPNISESLVNTADVSSASALLAEGAACNVIYINSVDVESLTGPQAIAKAVKMTFESLAPGQTTVVHFKVFSEGITLTDNNRKLFFRRHYPVSAVTYCGIDPQDRRWKRELDAPGGHGDARLFGFVARKQGTTNENTCHIFAELDPEQPASAIVNFVTKVMIGQTKLSS